MTAARFEPGFNLIRPPADSAAWRSAQAHRPGKGGVEPWGARVLELVELGPGDAKKSRKLLGAHDASCRWSGGGKGDWPLVELHYDPSASKSQKHKTARLKSCEPVKDRRTLYTDLDKTNCTYIFIIFAVPTEPVSSSRRMGNFIHSRSKCMRVFSRCKPFAHFSGWM